VRERNVAAVRDCISKGANVNACGIDRHFPLEWVLHGPSSGTEEGLKRSADAMMEILEMLLEAGANPNAKGEETWNHHYAYPLLRAAYTLEVDAVARLLHAGAEQRVTDSQGRTALQLARKEGADYRYPDRLKRFWKIVDHLDEGREFRLSEDGHKLLGVRERVNADVFKDANWKNTEEIETILKKADAAAVMHCAPQFNAFHKAAHRGYANLVRAMLDKGVDVNCQATTGETALVMALEFGFDEHVLNAEVVKILLNNSASIDIIGNSGRTPIALATYMSKNARDPEMRKEAELALKYLTSEGI
jgi:ankyrin repeat protein